MGGELDLMVGYSGYPFGCRGRLGLAVSNWLGCCYLGYFVHWRMRMSAVVHFAANLVTRYLAKTVWHQALLYWHRQFLWRGLLQDRNMDAPWLLLLLICNE